MSNSTENNQLTFNFEGKHPNIMCSTCSHGHINIDKNRILLEETASSLESHTHEGWEPYWITSRFCTIGTCNNKKCNESFIISGTSSLVESNTHYSQHGPEYFEHYKINYMSPPPLFFEIPEKCHDEVKLLILESFKLYFVNKGACVSTIRKSIEKLLDKFKIKKFNRTGPRRPFSLDSRITEFRKHNQDIGDILMAIKWIGNVGTHEDSIQDKDITECFSIYKHALEEIYLKKSQKIRQLVKSINKNKGPVRKKRAL